jgi:hypothetical protein
MMPHQEALEVRRHASGEPMTTTRPDGVTTILEDGDVIYLTGQGESPAGSRPFLDMARDQLEQIFDRWMNPVSRS